MTGAGTVTPVPEPSKSSRIKVGRKATTVPELDTLDSLQRGEVYIHQSGEKPYEDNQKLVLELEGPSPRRRLEVKSVTKTLTEAHASKTYVHSGDKSTLLNGLSDEPTVRVRRYGCRNRLRKAASVNGWILFISTAAGLIAATMTLFAVLSPAPKAGPDPENVQTALSWTVEPIIELPSEPSPPAQAAAIREFEHRWFQTQQCLQSMQGLTKPRGQIPKVTCARIAPSWLQRNGGTVSGLSALAVAGCGALVAFRRTGFQQSP